MFSRSVAVLAASVHKPLRLTVGSLAPFNMARTLE
jgi:hypothetical protein